MPSNCYKALPSSVTVWNVQTVRQIHEVKWLYLLNEMLYCDNSSRIWNPMNHQSASDLNTGHNILHTPFCNLEDIETCFPKQSGGTVERLSPFVVPFHQAFLILIGRFPPWPRHTQSYHKERGWLWAVTICWSSTPNPPTTKRKRKICSSILQEVQL